ncbi:fungal specific transcription factor [Colletotrichum plurivorum]|uniref:Fungal specific transcription factor n=1 Tax=Colletotrichum plurivorum TaxID=2175906 RepID=A0A8H6K187_9PEZI|nr:fungal specific transcription factor [Colletotrichum plurivorum]
MFKFINTTAERPQKRKVAAQACETCRKRKKRCEHLENAVASPPRTPDSESSPRTPLPSGSTRRPSEGSAVASSSRRPLVKSRPGNEQAAPRPVSRDLATASDQKPKPRVRTVDDDHGQHDDARFVGDLNPEGAFLADSPGTSRGYAESNSVGVWYSRRSVKTDVTSEVASAVSVDHAEHQFLAVLPRKAHYDKLEAIYLRYVHRIFPVLNLDILQKPSPSISQILCRQAVCLAAGSNPSANPFLTLGEDATTVLTYPEFAQRLSAAIRKALGLGLVKDRVQSTALLAILSLYTHFSEDRHLSAELAAQAVSNAQTVGLHLMNPPARSEDPSYLTRLFCCVWAADQLNAAFHGRPVMMHERDLGRDVQACIQEQDGCFRLFLEIVALLGRIIDLYRPARRTSNCLVMEDLPSFECLVDKAQALRVESRLLASLELLYHAISILSCRVPVGPSPSESASLAHTRQSLSAIKVTTIVEDFGPSLSHMTFVPYAVSLSLRVAYRELRSSKVPMLTARSRRQLQATCRVLRELGGMFRSALVMVDLAEQVLQEMAQVCSNAANKPDEQGGNGGASTHAANTPRQEAAPSTAQMGTEAANLPDPNALPEPQGSFITAFDESFYQGPAGLDVFEFFDPSFDLGAIDAILGGDAPPELGHFTPPLA